MAFFKCPKCEKIWQYPIEKCPECFLNLERIRTKKAKVIGILKNEISSLFHQKVPFYILLLEDEQGNRWIQKSVREYKIGQEIETQILKEKDGVVIWKVKYDFLEAVEKLVEILDNVRLDENSKILILPTLEKPSHPYFRDNSSPEFLEAVLEFLFENGVKPENIKVGSQSFDEIEIGQKALKSGLLNVCQKYKVLALNLEKENFVKRGDLEISEEVFKVDLLLNLPILKIGQAQATKNLFFLLKKENFFAQKYLYSEREIFEKLKNQIPEVLTIAEANHIRDEEGKTHYFNLIFGSFSPKNLDRVFFEILKMRELPQIISDVEIEKIEIFGREIDEI